MLLSDSHKNGSDVSCSGIEVVFTVRWVWTAAPDLINSSAISRLFFKTVVYSGVTPFYNTYK